MSTGQPWLEAWIIHEWCDKGTLTDAILRGWLQEANGRTVNHTLVVQLAAQAGPFPFSPAWILLVVAAVPEFAGHMIFEVNGAHLGRV